MVNTVVRWFCANKLKVNLEKAAQKIIYRRIVGNFPKFAIETYNFENNCCILIKYWEHYTKVMDSGFVEFRIPNDYRVATNMVQS